MVITPAYTAPSVYNGSLAASTRAALWQRLTSSFGYLNKEARFPIAACNATCTTRADSAEYCDFYTLLRNHQRLSKSAMALPMSVSTQIYDYSSPVLDSFFVMHAFLYWAY